MAHHSKKGTVAYENELVKAREWKRNHPEQVRALGREWKRNNKHKLKEYRDKAPWANHCYGAKTRCTAKKGAYANLGIKFRMTINDFKNLWFRDSAFLMRQPSIDRINPKGNYELPNCRFIELDVNRRRARGRRIQFHCNVVGCDHPHVSKGLCNMHYLRKWKRETSYSWRDGTS